MAGWVYSCIGDNGEFFYVNSVNTLAAAIGCPDAGAHLVNKKLQREMGVRKF